MKSQEKEMEKSILDDVQNLLGNMSIIEEGELNFNLMRDALNEKYNTELIWEKVPYGYKTTLYGVHIILLPKIKSMTMLIQEGGGEIENLKESITEKSADEKNKKMKNIIEIQEKEEKIINLENQIKDLEEQIVDLQTENKELKIQVKNLQEKIDHLNNEIKQLREEMNEKDKKMEKIERDHEETKNKLNETKNEFDRSQYLLKIRGLLVAFEKRLFQQLVRESVIKDVLYRIRDERNESMSMLFNLYTIETLYGLEEEEEDEDTTRSKKQEEEEEDEDTTRSKKQEDEKCMDVIDKVLIDFLPYLKTINSVNAEDLKIKQRVQIKNIISEWMKIWRVFKVDGNSISHPDFYEDDATAMNKFACKYIEDFNKDINAMSFTSFLEVYDIVHKKKYNKRGYDFEPRIVLSR